jgi:hypothetical protein
MGSCLLLGSDSYKSRIGFFFGIVMKGFTFLLFNEVRVFCESSWCMSRDRVLGYKKGV